MKKHSLIALAALACLFFVSCNSAPKPASSPPPVPSSQPSPSSAPPIPNVDNFSAFQNAADYFTVSAMANQFAKAYFTQDVATMKTMTTDDISAPFEQNEWHLSTLDHFLLKSLQGDSTKVRANFEFKAEDEDSYTYLLLLFEKYDDEWKIYFFTCEK